MSNLSDRDRKALTWGVIGVGAILVFNYVLAPLWQRWDESGSLLESRDAFVASFRERLGSQEGLRTRRDVLALRMGSLRAVQAKEEEKKPDEKPGEKPPQGGKPGEGGGKPGEGAKPEGEGKKDGDKQAEAKPGDGGESVPKDQEAAKAGGEPKQDKKKPDPDEKEKPSAQEGGKNDDPASGADKHASEDAGKADSGGKDAPEAPAFPKSADGGDDGKMVLAKNMPDDAGVKSAETEAKKPEAPAENAPAGGGGTETAEKAEGGEKAAGKAPADTKAPGQEGPPAEAEKKEAKKDEKEGEKEAKKAPAREAVPVVEASSLATYVEKNAKGAQVKIQRITPKKNSSGRKRTKYFEPVTLQVSFECQIAQLVKLLHDLEKGEQFVRVDQLEITRNLEQGDKLTASMEVSSYQLKETS